MRFYNILTFFEVAGIDSSSYYIINYNEMSEVKKDELPSAPQSGRDTPEVTPQSDADVAQERATVGGQVTQVASSIGLPEFDDDDGYDYGAFDSRS